MNMSLEDPNIVAFEPTIDTAWAFDEEWSTGLCKCKGHLTENLYAFCLFPCYLCHLTWRLRESCWSICGCCLSMPLATLRTKLRTLFRIKGSICEDCLVTTFCPCCSALQMQRHLRDRGVSINN